MKGFCKKCKKEIDETEQREGVCITCKKGLDFSKEILLIFWIEEKKALGLKKTQFICNIKKTHRDKVLRSLRKEKKIFYKQRRWFISNNFLNECKKEFDLE